MIEERKFEWIQCNFCPFPAICKVVESLPAPSKFIHMGKFVDYCAQHYRTRGDSNYLNYCGRKLYSSSKEPCWGKVYHLSHTLVSVIECCVKPISGEVFVCEGHLEIVTFPNHIGQYKEKNDKWSLPLEIGLCDTEGCNLFKEYYLIVLEKGICLCRKHWEEKIANE